MFEAKAEKTLIGAILQSRGEYLDDCHLTPDDFMNRQEQAVFAVMLKMRREGEGIDEFTVGAKLPEMAMRWANTAAITSLQCVPGSSTWLAGSTFALYGVSA